jgi:hypothetical protein
MSHNKHTDVTDMATDSPDDTLRPSNPSGVSMDKPTLRQEALKLMRYANTLTPYKLDEPLDPMVAGALDDWILRIATAIREAAPEKDDYKGVYEARAAASEAWNTAIDTYNYRLTARLGLDSRREETNETTTNQG